MSADRAPARAGASGRTSLRRRAREFVLQGLYQRQLSGNSAAAIREQIEAHRDWYEKADPADKTMLWEIIMGLECLLHKMDPAAK